MNEHRSKHDTEVEGVKGTVDELIERAFQYRGDVTIRTDDGKSLTGYLFNRNARARQPFVQLFETGTGCEVSIPYDDITHVLLTGRDAAAVSVRHFEVFRQKREELPRTGTNPLRPQSE